MTTLGVAPGNPAVVVPMRPSWHLRLAGRVIIAALAACMKTWRGRWQELPDCPPTPGPVIYCVWHNRLALTLASYDDFAKAKWPSAGLAAMISASRDGGLLAYIVEAFGLATIRGSSSRRGPQALLEATTWLEKNYSIAITPDGPRGPVYQVQEGIVHLAQVSGRPIIPISNFAHWKIRFASWDRFQLPLPFSRCEFFYGKPISVPRQASEGERNQIRALLQEAMMRITKD